MKSKLLFVLSTLAAMLFIQPANAQISVGPGDPIYQVMGPVIRQKAELDGYWGTRRVLTEAGSWAGALINQGHYAAGAGRALAEHGYRDGYRGEYGQSIGRTERTIETTAACATIGAAAGGLKGLLYGAGGCLAGNVLYDVVSGRKIRKLREAEARMIQAEAEREEREAKRQANVQAEHEERQQTATLYNNRTGRPVYVLDGNERVAVMQPGEPIELPEPRSGYRAVRHFKARNGRTVLKPAENRLEQDGSISFITPEGEVN